MNWSLPGPVRFPKIARAPAVLPRREQPDEAGQVSGEKAWQLPMWDEYQSYLDSNFADIANIAPGRAAGTIEGACFISRFTEDYRWAHVDIAGVADIGDGPNKGSTGKPVGMLFEYVNSNR